MPCNSMTMGFREGVAREGCGKGLRNLPVARSELHSHCGEKCITLIHLLFNGSAKSWEKKTKGCEGSENETAVRQRKFRTGYNRFRSFTAAPLNLLRDCHFCASADEDSSEIQFYLVFQLVGTSRAERVGPFIPADLILSLPPPYRFPDPRFRTPLCPFLGSLHRSIFALLPFSRVASLFPPSCARERKGFSQCIKRKGLTRGWSIKLNLFSSRFL